MLDKASITMHPETVRSAQYPVTVQALEILTGSNLPVGMYVLDTDGTTYVPVVSFTGDVHTFLVLSETINV